MYIYIYIYIFVYYICQPSELQFVVPPRTAPTASSTLQRQCAAAISRNVSDPGSAPVMAISNEKIKVKTI